MRPHLILLLLLGSSAAQEQRAWTASEVLAEHARALGPAAGVRALKVTGWTNLGGAFRFPRVEAYFSGGACYRNLFGLMEWVNDEGVFVAGGPLFERYRRRQESTRGSYYLQKALAIPFPLLPFLSNPAAQKGLKVGYTDKHLVLVAPPDEQGVHAEYFVTRKSFVLGQLLLKTSESEVVAALKYEEHKRVGGVLLPGAVRSYFRILMEDEEQKGRVGKGVRRVDALLKWEINPDLGGISFAVAGRGPGGARGFERIELKTGADPHDMGVGDLDGDGRNDLAVACDGGVSVHFGGAMHEPVFVPLGGGLHLGLAIEDLDRDRHPEIVVASRVTPARTCFFVSFDGQRKPKVTKRGGTPLFVVGLACDDFDVDGLGDLVSSGWGGERRLNINFGNGAGGFRVAGTSWPLANRKNPDPRGFGLDTGDLNGDGMKDIVVADGTRVRAFLGQANLAFLPGEPIKGGPRPVDVCLADLNGDGRNDLLVANDHPLRDLKGDIGILLNTGEGLKGHTHVEAGRRTMAVAAGRFNGDAFADAIASSYGTGEVTLLYGDGKGNLKATERLASGRGTHRLLVADLDGDGRDDICAANKLDDTVVIFLNRRKTAAAPRPAPARAQACPSLTGIEFKLEGLSAPYRFEAEFRLPEEIHDPSGIAFVHGDPVHRSFVLVSDKESSLFRAALVLGRKRLLVGPRIPLRGKGVAGRRLDLEGATFDHYSGNLFLACESGSAILRVSLFGQVFDEVATGIRNRSNDGIEGIAMRRRLDGTPLLYVFKERLGLTMKRPPVYVYGLEEDPFALAPRTQDPLTLPFATPDQTGAAVYGKKLYVVCRFMRSVVEIGFDGDGFAKGAKAASFFRLTHDLLGLQEKFGVVEGIALDAWGDMYLLVDNNRKVYGKPGVNRGGGGRLLWFRSLAEPKARPLPRRVVVQQIHIPWRGAKGNPKVARTRDQAGRAAEECVRRLRAGAAFDALADRHHYADSAWRRVMEIVAPPSKPRGGEILRERLPVAMGRLAFALDVGEVGLCEFHVKESPFGWHVLVRIE